MPKGSRLSQSRVLDHQHGVIHVYLEALVTPGCQVYSRFIDFFRRKTCLFLPTPSNRWFLEAFEYLKTTRNHLLEGAGRTVPRFSQILEHRSSRLSELFIPLRSFKSPVFCHRGQKRLVQRTPKNPPQKETRKTRNSTISCSLQK